MIDLFEDTAKANRETYETTFAISESPDMTMKSRIFGSAEEEDVKRYLSPRGWFYMHCDEESIALMDTASKVLVFAPCHNTFFCSHGMQPSDFRSGS